MSLLTQCSCKFDVRILENITFTGRHPESISALVSVDAGTARSVALPEGEDDRALTGLWMQEPWIDFFFLPGTVAGH